MGNQPSGVSREEIHAIAQFSEADIRVLYKRFRALDKDGNGQLEPSEILGVQELVENPLVKRVVNVFDADGDGRVSFIEFLVGLAKLAGSSGDASGPEAEAAAERAEHEKLMFLFKIYDLNGDGYISNGDLYKVMELMVGDNLTPIQLQQLVDRQMVAADKDRDGLLSVEEFKAAVQNIAITDQLKFDVNA